MSQMEHMPPPETPLLVQDPKFNIYSLWKTLGRIEMLLVSLTERLNAIETASENSSNALGSLAKTEARREERGALKDQRRHEFLQDLLKIVRPALIALVGFICAYLGKLTVMGG